MRFKKWPQLPGVGRTRAGHHHGSHTPTSPEAVLLGKIAYHPKHFCPECTKSCWKCEQNCGSHFWGQEQIHAVWTGASPRSLMPPLVIGPSLLFHLMNSNTYMGRKNFSMSVPALKTAPMILLKLSAWHGIINGVSKWLHLWPPIFLAYFWLSRLCEQSNSHTSRYVFQ